MTTASIVSRAWEVFRTDATAPPPLTLRGGNAVDSYSQPIPFDPAEDEPTDAYLERFAFWGLGYLDARSWRHYLPRLIDYAFRRPNDPAMVTEALVRSLRPPDRYPPRLATLSADQEDAVRSFLEQAALGDAVPHVQAEAQQALEEWWLPNARCRPTAQETAALRAAPVAHRVVGGDVYQLRCPRRSPEAASVRSREESRRVQTWGGLPVRRRVHGRRRQCDAARRAVTGRIRYGRAPRCFGKPCRRDRSSSGDPRRAERLDGLTHGDSPAEPQTLAMVFAIARDELVTLSIRSWPRDDVDRAVERIVDSSRDHPALRSDWPIDGQRLVFLAVVTPDRSARLGRPAANEAPP